MGAPRPGSGHLRPVPPRLPGRERVRVRQPRRPDLRLRERTGPPGIVVGRCRLGLLLDACLQLAPAHLALPHGRRAVLRPRAGPPPPRLRPPPRRERGPPLRLAPASHRVALEERRRGSALRRPSAPRRIGGLDLRAQGRPLHALLADRDVRLPGVGTSPRSGKVRTPRRSIHRRAAREAHGRDVALRAGPRRRLAARPARGARAGRSVRVAKARPSPEGEAPALRHRGRVRRRHRGGPEGFRGGVAGRNSIRRPGGERAPVVRRPPREDLLAHRPRRVLPAPLRGRGRSVPRERGGRRRPPSWRSPARRSPGGGPGRSSSGGGSGISARSCP